MDMIKMFNENKYKEEKNSYYKNSSYFIFKAM
ncbi:hypothetical protein AB210_3730 [Acinetobacter baumannii AB210]|nr:hypothetical protein AB210_3730 [Acinetobacter baumannii AB210]